MADEGDYAGRRAVMDCQALGEPLPPIWQTAQEELDAAISGLQVALDYCRGNAAQRQRVVRAAGRLRIAATLRPDLEPALQPLINRLDDALECIGWLGCGTVKEVQDEVRALLVRPE